MVVPAILSKLPSEDSRTEQLSSMLRPRSGRCIIGRICGIAYKRRDLLI